jgi:hypothetical protein
MQGSPDVNCMQVVRMGGCSNFGLQFIESGQDLELAIS